MNNISKPIYNYLMSFYMEEPRLTHSTTLNTQLIYYVKYLVA